MTSAPCSFPWCANGNLVQLCTRVAIAGMITLCSGTRVYAQVPRAVQDPAQRLLQEQRDRDRQREIAQPATQIEVEKPAKKSADVLSDVEQIPEPGPIFLIHQIDILGNTVLSAEEVNEITQAFINKSLGGTRINLLLRRFTAAFVKHGLITTRGYLGEQNLKSGVLVITFVPGKVEAIQLNGQALSPSQSGATPDSGGLLTDLGVKLAMPTAPGELLNLTDLEQGVEQINRMRRNKAELQILPGTTPGGSIIDLNNKAGDRLWLTAGVDNYGSQQTGLNRSRFGIEADNALGFQEVLSLNYSGSRETNALVASASVPYGYNTFSYTTSMSEYQSLISDTALLYGNTTGSSWAWNRVLSRSQSAKTAIDTSLSLRRADRDINDLTLTPQKLSVLRVGINTLQRFLVRQQPATLTLEAGVSRGLSAFGADQDSAGIQSDEAHSQFTKLDFNGTLSTALPTVASASLTFKSQINGQWSNQALFGSEQIFVGGMSSVRGFRESDISGDRGIYARNEVIWANAPHLGDVQLEPYAFFDIGMTELISEQHTRKISGLGVGVRLQLQQGKHGWSSELTLGRPVQQPDDVEQKGTLLLATLN